MQRRLVAVLAADVVGYSRLMGEDEEGTVRSLKEHRQAVLAPEIAGHRGRIVNTAGDGLLAEFASVVDAVDCAYAIQARVAERNADVETGRRLEFRIGINLGDVIIDGDDILGDGVNIAARLEAIAQPGGICVSAVVRDQVMEKRTLDFQDLGERTVKNIARPLRVYRLAVGPTGSAAPAPPPLPDRPSIAVMPFANMTGDAGQDYFADGIVEDIITALSRFKEFFVIARNSTFVYKGRAVDIQQAARELGVRYVLEGSVRRGGNRVRISGQLIEAATRSNLWANRFDGTIDDVFDLQDRITENVVAALAPTLHQAEIERARSKPTTNLDAYDYLLRAVPMVVANAAEEAATAIELLSEALRRSPAYARAHAYIAMAYAQIYRSARWAGARRASGEGDRPRPTSRAAGRGRQRRARAWRIRSAGHGAGRRGGTRRPRQGGDAQSEPDDGVCLPRARPGHGRRARACDRGRHPRLALEPARSCELPTPDGACDFLHLASPIR